MEKARDGADDVVIHFNLHFSPTIKPELNSADVYLVLATELLHNSRSGLFKNVSVEQSSLDITERRDASLKAPPPFRPVGAVGSSSSAASRFYNGDPWEPRTRFPGLIEGLSTEPTPAPRKCTRVGLPFCERVLPYNETSYPNLAGHWNLTSTESELSTYRQLVDAECYPLAREFVCRLLQPECVDRDELVWPCRDFCEDFKKACKNWLPASVEKALRCREYPRFSGDTVEQEEGDFQPSLSSGGRELLVSALDDSSTGLGLSADKERKASRKERRKCKPKPVLPPRSRELDEAEWGRPYTVYP